MNDLVSIIMPAYNAEAYIEQSIVSVMGQTYKNWELIIIDDGSTDGTATIAKNHIELDSRVKLITQQNKRLGAARNAGINTATGQWIAFLDSDDLWDPSKLEKQLLKSGEISDADVIFTSGWAFNNNDLADLTHYKILTGEFDAELMYRYEYFNNYIPVMSVLVKKSMVDKVGQQEIHRSCYGCEDWDYWLRMALCGAKFYGMEEQLFYYRRHDNNMSSNIIKMKLAQLAVFVKNYQPQILDYRETMSAFIPLVNSLLMDLVSSGKKRYAIKVIGKLRSIIPGLALLYLLLLLVVNRSTIYFFYLINRVYIKVKKRLNTSN